MSHISRESVNQATEEAGKAGTSSDNVNIAQESRFNTFIWSCLATLEVLPYTHQNNTSFSFILIDWEYEGKGIVNGNEGWRKRESNGHVYADSVAKLKTTRWMSIFTLNNAIYVNFNDENHLHVGLYVGTWEASSVQSDSGICTWQG